MAFAESYLAESIAVLSALDRNDIEDCATGLAAVRERGGRLFILGVGGSAGHASHAVNDFRKIAMFEAYTPTDNVSELTARVNDEGWDSTFAEWLRGSRLTAKDGILVFSVGGGNREANISANLVQALELAQRAGRFDLRHRRPGWRVHRRGDGLVRGDSSSLPGSRDPAHRGSVRRRVALAGLASRLGSGGDEMGIAMNRDPRPRMMTGREQDSQPRRVEVVGGAGFIGAHFVDRLLGRPRGRDRTVYDNFSSGREWHLAALTMTPGSRWSRAEIGDLDALTDSMAGIETVIHLASNPDIARAATEPAVDFDQGTLLTHHVLEAMRRAGAGRILYASGSGVYGDLGESEPDEDHGPLVPVSTYGASKLAGEALISSYATCSTSSASLPLRQCGRAASDPRSWLRLRQAAPCGTERAAHSRRRIAEQILRARRRCDRCRPSGRDGGAPTLRRLQRRHR